MEMRGFNKEKSSDKILLLVEEVGELAKAVRKNEKKLGIDKTKEYNYSSIESEIADIFIILFIYMWYFEYRFINRIWSMNK